MLSKIILHDWYFFYLNLNCLILAQFFLIYIKFLIFHDCKGEYHIAHKFFFL